jgi:hypothetical protein
MYLCFALHEGQAKNHLYIFSYDLNTRLTFIVSFSWSFICVLFYVITWLLSFYYQDYIFHAHVLSSYDPNTQCLHRWSRLCRCMSPQKLFFCYHLPTRGRAGVKLEDAWYVQNVSIIFDAPCLIRPKRIYNFWCSMLVFDALEKLHRKYSRNWMKQKPNVQKFTEASREPKRRRSGATRAPHNRAARPGPWHTPYVWGCLGPLLTLPLCL